MRIAMQTNKWDDEIHARVAVTKSVQPSSLKSATPTQH